MLVHWIGPTLNELPFSLLLASKGLIRSTKWIGLHKRAPLSVCQSAEWERRGGRAPTGVYAVRPKLARAQALYHRAVMREITAAIAVMDVTDGEKARITKAARGALLVHLAQSLAGWKPRATLDHWPERQLSQLTRFK